MKFLILFTFLITSMCSFPLWATGNTPSKKKKIGMDQSDLMPKKNKFGFIGTYNLSYNSLEQVKFKTNKHRLSLSGAYSFEEHWSAYGGFSVSHESFKMNIVRENESDPFHKISNFNLGVIYNQRVPLNFIRHSSGTFNLGLPVSERARVDKHVANFSFSYFIESYKWKGLSLIDRASINYIWNTQRFSLFLNDQMSNDWLVSNSFGLKYIFLEKLGIRLTYLVSMKRYVDKSWDLEFGNNLSLFANIKNFQFFISMINNSYQENDRIDIGYYDRYRRIFVGGVTYVF